MPKWFIIFGIVALCGVGLAQIGDLVTVTTLFTFGLMLPVWLVLANLWIVWLLMLPVVLGVRWGRGVAGVLCACAIAAAGLFWVQRGVARDLAQFAPPPMVSIAGALAASRARSIDLVTNDPGFTENGACGVPCEQLLTAGLDWLRITDQTDAQHPQSWVIRRTDLADCLALDADFPPAAPCLVAAADRAEVAEVQIVHVLTRFGPAEGNQGAMAGLIAATRLKVTDGRSGRVLHDAVAQRWWQVKVSPYVTPRMGNFSGGSSAPRLVRNQHADPEPVLMDVLAMLGQPVAAPRGMEPVAGAHAWQPQIRLSEKPQDTALVLSILETGPAALPPAMTRQVDRWIGSVNNGRPVTDAVRRGLAMAVSRGLRSGALQRLMTERPDLFDDRPGG